MLRLLRFLRIDDCLIRAFSYFGPYVWIVTGGLVLLIVSTLTGLLFPLITRHIIDVVLPSKDVQMLWILGILSVIVPTASQGLGLIQGYVFARIGVRVTAKFRRDVLKRVLHWPLSTWDNMKTGEMQSRLGNDTASIQSLVTEVMPHLFRNLLTLPSALFMLFALDRQLTLVCLSFIPIYVIPATFFGPRVRTAWRDVAERRGDLIRDIQENLLGIRVIKTLVREAWQLNLINTPIVEYIRAHLTADKTGRLYSLTISIAGALVPAGLIVYGGMRVMTGDTTIGTLVAFITYLQQMYGSVSSIPSLYMQTRRYSAHLERVFEYLDMEPEDYTGKQIPSISGSNKKVIFEDVWFAYNDRNNALSGVSFELEDGEIAALVGPSGCGKSTVASLTVGLYRPQKGRISVGGYSLDDVDLRELRNYVGLVAQDTFLFNASIMDNIRYGNPDATEREIEEAARIARVHDFAEDLNNGYETVVGERGVQLSGGQRQRIAIARTVLQNPPILLLDEATSSLDPGTEAEVQEALLELMQGRTCLIITHRLNTIMNASKIMVMQDGVIVQQGSHEALTRLSSVYREMLERQGRGVRRM